MSEKKYTSQDEVYMHKALDQAGKAFAHNEVPIGAVVVDADGAIIGIGYNQVEGRKTQCAHAEMRAIMQASDQRGDWRLDGCTIYVTLEPCSMCYSLLRISRIQTLVYGASSPRFGYQLDNVATSSVYKNDVRVVSGVCAEQSEQLLKRFFQMQRIKKGEHKTGSQKNQSESP